jgi:hypothetical protein
LQAQQYQTEHNNNDESPSQAGARPRTRFCDEHHQDDQSPARYWSRYRQPKESVFVHSGPTIARWLFLSSQFPAAIPCVAAGLFGGLRPDKEAARLLASDVQKDNTIHVPGYHAKDRQQR